MDTMLYLIENNYYKHVLYMEIFLIYFEKSNTSIDDMI